MSNFAVHNHVTHEAFAHPEVHRAQQEGDREKASSIIETLRRPDGSLDTSKYERVLKLKACNINTLEGKKIALDSITGVVDNSSRGWYLGPFESDDTPDLTWDARWATGAATEFTRYTGTDPAGGRQECNFAAATGSSSRVDATNPVMAVLTIDSGLGGAVPLYGVTVNSSSVKNYSGAGEYLLAAVRYPAAVPVDDAEVHYFKYGIYIP